ncbi:MAG: DUF539 domain-containing protein [Candidatus Methylomirabilales bacterium]
MGVEGDAMEIFLISFAVMVIALLGMGIGVLFGRQGIKGSCGGLSSGGCGICTERCEREEEA